MTKRAEELAMKHGLTHVDIATGKKIVVDTRAVSAIDECRRETIEECAKIVGDAFDDSASTDYNHGVRVSQHVIRAMVSA